MKKTLSNIVIAILSMVFSGYLVSGITSAEASILIKLYVWLSALVFAAGGYFLFAITIGKLLGKKNEWHEFHHDLIHDIHQN